MMKIIMKTGAFALLLLAACTRENPADTGSAELIATFADAATRTSYSYNEGTNFSWDDGDQILVLTTDYDILTGTEIGTLTGTLTPYTDRTRAKVTLNGEGTRDKIAFYPENMFWDYSIVDSRSIIRFKLYDFYDLTNKGKEWSPIPMFAWNDPNSNNLNFVHLCSLFRIICYNVPVGTQFIRVSGYQIAGIPAMSVSTADSERYNPGFLETGDKVTYKVSDSPLSTIQSEVVVNLPIPASSSGEGTWYEDLEVSALNEREETISGPVQLFTSGMRALPGNGYKYTVNFPPPDPGY